MTETEYIQILHRHLPEYSLRALRRILKIVKTEIIMALARKENVHLEKIGTLSRICTPRYQYSKALDMDIWMRHYDFIHFSPEK